MAKELIDVKVQEQTLNGQTVEAPVYETMRFWAKDNSTSGVRLSSAITGETWLWAGDINDVLPSTPVSDPNWIPENTL